MVMIIPLLHDSLPHTSDVFTQKSHHETVIRAKPIDAAAFHRRSQMGRQNHSRREETTREPSFEIDARLPNCRIALLFEWPVFQREPR